MVRVQVGFVLTCALAASTGACGSKEPPTMLQFDGGPVDARDSGLGDEGVDAGIADEGVDAGAADNTCGTGVFPAPTVVINASFQGDLYIDGQFTGLQTPATVDRWVGRRRVAVGGHDRGYLRADIDPQARCEVELLDDARVAPRIWRARFITFANAVATLPSGADCNATLNTADADRTYASFTASLANHFGPFSHSTMLWESEHLHVAEPVVIRNLGWAHAPEPDDVEPLLQDVNPGELDLVVVFYRSVGPGCVIPGPFFGLGLPPSPESREAGFVAVKMETDEPLGPWWDYFDNNDPGVWIHEWLHTVADNNRGPGYYPGLGARLPPPGSDGSIVHDAETYNYVEPWMNWYSDLIVGRVPLLDEYRGIGPDWLLKCTVKDRVTDPACR